MRVLVADASVLMDLERGRLLETVLSSTVKLGVPDLLYEHELKNRNGPKLVEWGLCVEELDARAVTLAAKYKQRCSALCLAESFALALAKISNWTMLSSNPTLCKLARAEQINCHNFLWLLDRIVAERVISLEHLHSCLMTILNSPCCCLPRHEVNEWIQRLFTKKLS